MGDYPEHEKLQKIGTKSQSIGEFLDWLPSQGISLMTWMEYDAEEPCGWCDAGKAIRPKPCNECHGTGTRRTRVEGWYHARQTIEELLATYFDIDRDKLEEEKRAMLDHLRRLNEPSAT